MWCFLLFWQFFHGAQGWEFTVKGQCRIHRVQDGIFLVDAANQRPVAAGEVEIREGDRLWRVKTDTKGRIPVNGPGLLGLTHPGSELYEPCAAVTLIPVAGERLNQFTWKWLGLVAGLGLILIALFPVVRTRWRRFGKAKKEEPPGEAPEVEFNPPASRTFVPWRKAGFHGQVQVWESGLPLAGVEISYLEHSAPGKTETDGDGRFFLPSSAVEIRFARDGYHTVGVPRPRGQILVRMMSLPVRALWLLRQICRNYDRQRYAKLSPRQALSARIPPPEVIGRLERLAYAGEMPEPGEIERMEAALTPESEEPT